MLLFLKACTIVTYEYFVEVARHVIKNAQSIM